MNELEQLLAERQDLLNKGFIKSARALDARIGKLLKEQREADAKKEQAQKIAQQEQDKNHKKGK